MEVNPQNSAVDAAEVTGQSSLSLMMIVATCLVSAVSAVMFNILPLFLGAAADAHNLSDLQLGLLGSAGLLGATLVALTSIVWVRRVNWRVLSGIAFGMTVVLLVIYASIQSFYGMLGLQFLIGCCLGSTFSLVLCLIGDVPHPDSLFAFKSFAEIGLGCFLMYLLPRMVMPSWGFPGILISIAVVVAVLAVFIPFLPCRAMDTVATSPKTAGNKLTWVALSALFLFFGAMAGFWAFLERIGVDAGLSQADVSTAIVASMVVGLVATLIGGIIGDRFGRTIFLLACAVLLGVGMLLLAQPLTVLLYLAASCIFSFGWNYIMPYQMAIIGEADSSGRLIVLIAVALTLGGAFGPALMGLVKTGSSYTPIFVVTAVAVVASTILFILVVRYLSCRGSESTGINPMLDESLTDNSL